jgi:hypothetical protein
MLMVVIVVVMVMIMLMIVILLCNRSFLIRWLNNLAANYGNASADTKTTTATENGSADIPTTLK